MRPDALPVRPLATSAVLPPGAVASLFGTGYRLRGTERVDVTRLGQTVARAPVAAGPALRLRLDAVDRADLAGLDGLRLVGPAGSVGAPGPETGPGRLCLPDRLATAWGVGAEAVVALGAVAVRLPVEAASEVAVEVDRALWVAAGAPAEGRWLPGVAWAVPLAEPDAEASRTMAVPRRVVTETDVRQARLKHQTIRVEPGQIVTPAAQSLGRELGIWDRPPSSPTPS